MDQPDREAEPHFSHPIRQIVMMLVVMALSAVGIFFALPRVLPVFLANPYLNGFIGFVFVIGLMACFYQVYQIIRSVGWIAAFVGEGDHDARAPQILAPLATLLASRGKRMQISSGSARSILDSVATRIDEEREITRYIVNMLIFLGLLGTFYGLATTVPAVVDTIRSLAPQEGEGGVEVFNRLMTGLEAQLGGMGVAFASSLLGLAGSLIIGLLELLAGHGQNRFYRELEEWLSSITRLGFTSGEGEVGTEQMMIAGVVDSMAEQMEDLHQLFTQSDVSRAMVDEKLGHLTDAIERMTYRMSDQNPVNTALMQVAEGQSVLIEELRQRGASNPEGGGIDAESRMRLRSIDVQMLRILEEISAGRQETMAELRTDINALVKVLSDQGKPRTLKLQPKTKPVGKEG
ncbi:biopolymer transporter ExbB [Alisedimentitalea sp. MJ-SS2]|uniref:biopolymer transporter ExbB n=1 Tax=Aliisedimentitalea sp. MJ-SS2 TaxID=3049795 RepID=UPI00290C0BDB|nr:biopolymer transporter ExbB [Alisedimentitalea sp. MJ-SS2]MDU8926074.1 biopolymer transporter ExbB [Alisedimentitalea sp. MJ-SS2]